MTSIEVVVVIFGIMLVLMAVRVPIAISMFIAGAYGYIVQTGWLPFASFLNKKIRNRGANEFQGTPHLQSDFVFFIYYYRTDL